MSDFILVPPSSAPERILNYGATGAGKTNAIFCILAKTQGRAWYLDTDMTVIDFLAGERFAPLSERINVYTPDDMEEAIQFLETASKEAVPGEDWIVVDRIDWAWDEAQNEFSTKVFGASVDEHFMAFRQAFEAEKKKDNDKKSGNPFDGLADWPTIKKRHTRFTRALLKATQRGVHWYAAASEKTIIEKLEKDQDVLRTYGRIGARPAGEKFNGHLARTVLRLMGNSPTTWRMTTVKDRERKQLDGHGVKDFALDYLVEVAGWEVKV